MAVKNSEPSQLHDSVFSRVTIVNADASAYKTIIAPTASDNSKESHLFSIKVTSDDTSARDLIFAINDGTNDNEEGGITIAINQGFSVALPPAEVVANRSIPVLSRIMKDIRGNWFIPIRPGETLKVKSLTTVTAAKTIVITCFGYNFTRT
jgi:hypothetical protein